MEKEKILDRVKKLLALSENNPSEEEAESAMLTVQRLLAKYGLAMSDVEEMETPETDEPVITEEASHLKRIPWWHAGLANIIARNFRCECLLMRQRRGRTLLFTYVRFYGHPKDAAVCKEVYQYAVRYADWASHVYVEQCKRMRGPIKTTGIKNDFLSGFLSGLQEKFQKQVKENNWQLVVVSDEAVKNAAKKDTNGKTHRRSVQFNQDAGALSAGYQKGAQFEPVKGAISHENKAAEPV